MEKYEVKIFSTAKQDLLEIIDYLNTLSPETALRYYDKLTEEIGGLSHMPERCPRPRDLALAAKGYRYLIVENYLVFYTISGQTVQIQRILYGRRNYRKHFVKMSGRERICVPGRLLSPGDESEDLLRKSYYNAARDGEDTVGALGGVVGLEGEAHLEDAVTQQDEAHGPDEGKDEVGQAGDHGQRVIRRKGGDDGEGQGQDEAGKQGVKPLCPPLEVAVEIMFHAAFSSLSLSSSAENA